MLTDIRWPDEMQKRPCSLGGLTSHILTMEHHGLQVLDLPQGSRGLDWIVAQGSSQLLLLPGLKPASVAAASAGDQDTLAYLRFAAQQFAAHGSTRNMSALQNLCLEASSIRDCGSLGALLDSKKRCQQLSSMYRARRAYTVQLLQRTVFQGQLESLKWLRAMCHRCCSDELGLMELAARHSHISILKYLRAGPDPAPWDGCVAALHIECLLWLISQEPPCPCHSDIVWDVAHTGNLDALVQLRSASKLSLDRWNEDVCECAAASGNLAMLRYLRSLDPPVPWNREVCFEAAASGNSSMLQWARAQDPPCPWDAGRSAQAAARGDLHMLGCMCAQDPPCPLGSGCIRAAAFKGQREALKWLRSRQPPCPWDAECMPSAAACPDLRIVKWMRSQHPPCPFDESTMGLPALHGNLPMLQYLWEQDQAGFLSPIITHQAVLSGQLPVLEWASRQEQQPQLWYGDLYCLAACSSQIEILKWLHAKGVPVPTAMSNVGTLDGCESSLGSAWVPILMFLGDIGAFLPALHYKQLTQARRTFCTFHGLLRWCRRAVSDPSRGIHQAFDELLPTVTGQHLLVHLCLLPLELVSRIAVAADLQHDYFQA